MNISTNATHYYPQSFQAGRRVIIEICGADFSGGTVTPGFKAADGEFSPFLKSDGTAITTTTRGGFEVRVPRSGVLGITLEGGTNPAIVLDIIHAVEMPPGS